MTGKSNIVLILIIGIKLRKGIKGKSKISAGGKGIKLRRRRWKLGLIKVKISVCKIRNMIEWIKVRLSLLTQLNSSRKNYKQISLALHRSPKNTHLLSPSIKTNLLSALK
jgi:hypothetical protein